MKQTSSLDDAASRFALPAARISLFLIYAWFGALKVIGQSPASPLVQDLQEKTLSFINFDTFMVLFGLAEVGIGALFLWKGKEKLALIVMLLHMATTLLPLILLPSDVWQHPFVPTLEGQYIIKNLALISLALCIVTLSRAAKPR